MLRRERDLLTPRETPDNDCKVGASCAGGHAVCVCEAGPCTLYSEAHTPSLDSLQCENCGKNRVVITRHSEGYGTEEECVLSDPQGESDADADIEDTDSRLQGRGPLQRISSRRRKRPQVARQDTTESEDDGGRSHRSHRWNLRLSPERAHSRTILEESISQVRPLVICRPDVQLSSSGVQTRPQGAKLTSVWPPSLPVALVLFLSLPLSLSLLILIVSFLLPWTRA